MDQRVSLITLGVGDVDRSRRFYEALGWRVGLDVQGTVFFQAGGSIVTLWSREALAADSGVDDPGGWGGITLAQNVRSREEVDAIVERARAAGARVTREPAETFYGGYAGVFLDPDGHAWEIAHNPGSPSPTTTRSRSRPPEVRSMPSRPEAGRPPRFEGGPAWPTSST